MDRAKAENIIGYYERDDVIRPIFERFSGEEFSKKYPGKEPIIDVNFADNWDYIFDKDEVKVEFV
ncbi:MAG: hypothetical protein K8T10_18640 [Candidatus Eremiobacteraeota bacterium]|nr:hypothetical protein [Candidatus Eremiobacteraeota bacterium]